MFWNRNHAQEQRRVARPSFQLQLEILEARTLLDASPMPSPHLSPDQVEAAFQFIIASAEASSGPGTPSPLPPIPQLLNNWNSLANDIATPSPQNIPPDSLAVSKSLNNFVSPDPGNLELQAASRLPPGEARGGADIALMFQGALEIVQGAVTFNPKLVKSGYNLASGAASDYVTMIDQAAQQFLHGNFSLQGGSSSGGTGSSNGSGEINTQNGQVATGSHLVFASRMSSSGSGNGSGVGMFANTGSLTLGK